MQNSHFQLPKEVQELEKELLQIAKEKDKVITSQDFEKVIVLLHCCILDIIRSYKHGPSCEAHQRILIINY